MDATYDIAPELNADFYAREHHKAAYAALITSDEARKIAEETMMFCFLATGAEIEADIQQYVTRFLRALRGKLAAAAPPPPKTLSSLVSCLGDEPTAADVAAGLYPMADLYPHMCSLPAAHGRIDYSRLPVFGGDPIPYIADVLSYSDTHVLVGTTQDDSELIPRRHLEAE